MRQLFHLELQVKVKISNRQRSRIYTEQYRRGGYLPVFTSREKANAYAKEKEQVSHMKMYGGADRARLIVRDGVPPLLEYGERSPHAAPVAR